MSKLNLINNLINSIKENQLIKCLFTDELINKGDSLIINLYVLINNEHYNLIFDYIDNLMIEYNHLIHDSNNDNVSSYYYDNHLNINVTYLFDYNYDSYYDKVIIYDPNNLIDNFKIETFPLLNKEFAENIELLSKYLFEFYNAYITNDKIYTYKISKQIEDIFILLYRGYYDSLNAKKEYLGIQETMPFNYYNNLLSIIKIFKYDLVIDAVQVIINEMDAIINNLPVNIISLFNYDFYTFTKKLVYSL